MIKGTHMLKVSEQCFVNSLSLSTSLMTKYSRQENRKARRAQNPNKLIVPADIPL